MRAAIPLLSILLALSFAGCAKTKLTPRFPESIGSSQTAQVVVLRSGSIVRGYVTAELTLDEWSIARLRRNQHVRFDVSPGRHSLGVIVGTEFVDFEAGETRYFIISPNWMTTFVLRPIDEAEAKERLEESTDITPGAVYWKEEAEKEAEKAAKKAAKEAKKNAKRR